MMYSTHYYTHNFNKAVDYSSTFHFEFLITVSSMNLLMVSVLMLSLKMAKCDRTENHWIFLTRLIVWV